LVQEQLRYERLYFKAEEEVEEVGAVRAKSVREKRV